MNSKRFLRAFAGVAVVLILAAMMLFPQGCSKLLPTAPDESQIQGYRAEELWPAPPADLAGWLVPCSAEASDVFFKKGGTLNVVADCFELKFEVPAGALSSKVFISVKASLFNYWSDGEFQKGLRFNFSPDGLAFGQPAAIEFEASVLGAKNGEVLKLYYFNTHTGLWQLEQTVVVKDESFDLKFEVSHFSRYAIS